MASTYQRKYRKIEIDAWMGTSQEELSLWNVNRKDEILDKARR